MAQARRNLISRLSLCVPSLIELILAGVECGINVECCCGWQLKVSSQFSVEGVLYKYVLALWGTWIYMNYICRYSLSLSRWHMTIWSGWLSPPEPRNLAYNALRVMWHGYGNGGIRFCLDGTCRALCRDVNMTPPQKRGTREVNSTLEAFEL